MENCFERFRMSLINGALGLLFFQCSTVMGADINPSISRDENSSGAALKLSFDRGEFGMSSDENIFNPSISLSGEYTDNIFETQVNKKSDFITHITPGIGIKYRAPFWDWDLSYNLDYLNYARNTRSSELNHILDVKGNLRLIDDFFTLGVSDTYKKVSLDVNRDTTTSSNFVNQTDQNILTLAPRIEFRPRPNLLLTSGYHYTKESYLNASSVSSSLSGVDKEEHGVFVTASYELTPKSTTTTNLQYTYVLPGQESNYHQILPTIGLRHEFTNNSFLILEVGYNWIIYTNGSSVSGPYWNAGITYAFERWVASLNTLVKYNVDPLRGSTEEKSFTGSLVKTLDRGSAGLFAGYSQLRDNQADALASTKLWTGINLKRDITDKIFVHLDLNGEKVDIKDNSNFNNDITAPYRFHISAGASCAVSSNLTVSLDYTYTTYRQSVGSSINNTEISRVIFGVSKFF